jgi:hypothetical protein
MSLGGAGLVLGGVATGLGVAKAASLRDSGRCPNGACTHASTSVATLHTDSVLASAGFLAGGSLMATGALLFFGGPRFAKARRDTALLPLVGPGFVGAEGRFQ